MSIVNTAITAIVDALNAAPAVENVSRVRVRQVSAGTSTAVVVRPVDSQVAQASVTSSQPITWETRIGVECYARAAANQAPDIAVDALLSTVYAKLMTDPTLSGAVIALQPQSVSYEFDADAENTVCATFVFSARQRAAVATF
jgi:hypothetical protein